MKRWKRWARRVGIALLVFTGFVYLNNTSHLAPALGDGPVLVAHRALGQAYDRTELNAQTCTAERWIPTGHTYLENTIPSMRAAFDFGAGWVEFDVQRTTDDHFAVFHDWTLDCRTNGTGVTREHTLAELQALDIGYGYTADGGATYPFRGTGVGLMPSLDEVLAAFPEGAFIIDVKSNERDEGVLLAERLAALPQARQDLLIVYGGAEPVAAVRARLPHLKTTTRPQLKGCLLRYMLLGWTGHVPCDCENSMLTIPANVAPWLWGWPNRFLQRMDGAGSMVVLLGDYGGEGFSTPFDDPARFELLGPDYGGGVWTDRIDLLGAASETTASL